MNGTRASPDPCVPRSDDFDASKSFWDDPRMDDPVPGRRRDPAWRWYALAVAALVLVLVLELTGVFDQLAP